MRYWRWFVLLLAASCGELPLVGSDAGAKDAGVKDVGVEDVEAEAPFDAGSDVVDATEPVATTDAASDVDGDGSDGTDAVAIDASDGGPPITTLSSGQGSLADLTVDTSNVYWTASKSVLSCGVNGCGGQPTVLVSGSYWTAEIATDGVNVYFQAQGLFASACAVTGCGNSPTALSEGGTGMATDGTYVFYGDQSHGGLAECSVNGCTTPPPRLILSGNYNQFAVDNTNVYWTNRTNGSEVWMCAKAGCNGAGTLLADSNGGVYSPQGIATDGVYVYWTNVGNGTIQKCAVTGCNDQPTTLATLQNNPVKIVTDGVNVYWVEEGAGTVRKCAVGGCANNPTTLVSGQSYPVSIAVDATSVYWGEMAGTVKKAPK